MSAALAGAPGPVVHVIGGERADDRVLLEQSVELVAQREGQFVRRVYATLFRDHPEAEELFSHYGEERQAEMLSETVAAVLDLLGGETWTPGHVLAMGERHRNAYVVRDEMYAWFSDAIIDALRELSGSDWDSATEGAWRRALDAVNALMTEHSP